MKRLSLVIGALIAAVVMLRRGYRPARLFLLAWSLFLLGTATVALALPLFTHFRRVKAMAGPLLTALLLGSLAAMGSAMLIAEQLAAIVDAPVAVAIQRQ